MLKQRCSIYGMHGYGASQLLHYCVERERGVRISSFLICVMFHAIFFETHCIEKYVGQQVALRCCSWFYSIFWTLSSLFSTLLYILVPREKMLKGYSQLGMNQQVHTQQNSNTLTTRNPHNFCEFHFQKANQKLDYLSDNLSHLLAVLQI